MEITFEEPVIHSGKLAVYGSYSNGVFASNGNGIINGIMYGQIVYVSNPDYLMSLDNAMMLADEIEYASAILPEIFLVDSEEHLQYLKKLANSERTDFATIDDIVNHITTPGNTPIFTQIINQDVLQYAFGQYFAMLPGNITVADIKSILSTQKLNFNEEHSVIVPHMDMWEFLLHDAVTSLQSTCRESCRGNVSEAADYLSKACLSYMDVQKFRQEIYELGFDVSEIRDLVSDYGLATIAMDGTARTAHVEEAKQKVYEHFIEALEEAHVMDMFERLFCNGKQQ